VNSGNFGEQIEKTLENEELSTQLGDGALSLFGFGGVVVGEGQSPQQHSLKLTSYGQVFSATDRFSLNRLYDLCL
jgi:hypothetical protein